jgi:hypothetical protein
MQLLYLRTIKQNTVWWTNMYTLSILAIHKLVSEIHYILWLVVSRNFLW